MHPGSIPGRASSGRPIGDTLWDRCACRLGERSTVFMEQWTCNSRAETGTAQRRFSADVLGASLFCLMLAAFSASAQNGSSLRSSEPSHTVRSSHVELPGDAWTWWDQAKGRYDRGQRPRVRAVIALPRQPSLPSGLVAVVSRIIESRVLMLDHARWPEASAEGESITLFDVSPNNDWTTIKVYQRSGATVGGRTYQVYGFIYPPRAAKATSREPSDLSTELQFFWRSND